MIRFAAAIAFGVAVSIPSVGSAASHDPDWPCQQIKVPELSLASVWAGPPVDTNARAWQDDQQIADLVQKVAPRREPIDQAQHLIHDFAQQAGGQKQPQLLEVLGGVFNVLDSERDSIMAGLDRFGSRQKELAAGIRAENERLQALQADSNSDPTQVQKLTQQVKWDVEVFQDRRQAISYACDAPTKIEQRLFALAQQIQQELQ